FPKDFYHDCCSLQPMEYFRSDSPSSTGLTFRNLQEIVEPLFKVSTSYLDYKQYGIPTFILDQDQETEKPFEELRAQLEEHNLMPTLRDEERTTSAITSAISSSSENIQTAKVLRIIPKMERPERDRRWNLALFAATIVTVAITGYLMAANAAFQSIYNGVGPLEVLITFTMALIGVVGLHELGHLISLRRHKIKSSLPYFIPGLPFWGLPTFGAVIVQRSPPTNRKELYDMGISGPLLGFAVSLIVAIIGIMISVPIWTLEDYIDLTENFQLSSIPEPLIFRLLVGFLHPGAYTIFLHPIGLAGWLGMLITALNLFPIGQLDGGHTMRSLFGSKSRYISIGGAFVLSALGYFFMAILVLFMGGIDHPGPLDDVSKLSIGRKILSVSIIVIIILCTPPLIFAFF
ncbi:MAG: site-2 protease family protein, partial [Candidatus Hodarchaeota archaeon]